MPETRRIGSIPARDPGPLYDVLREAARGVKRYRALRAAMGLGVLHGLRQERDGAELAHSLGLVPELLEALCAVLADMGLVERVDGKWRRTAAAEEYLDPASPLNQLENLACLEDDFRLWDGLPDRMRHGSVDMGGCVAFHGKFIEALARGSLLGEVQRTAEAVAAVPGFDKARTLLDLGGGHGLYAMAVCERNPNLAATVLDTAAARPVFYAFAKEFHASRVRFWAGDLFREDWGTGHDIVLLSYNPGGKQAALLERIHACLAQGGLFVTKHAYYGAEEGSKDPLLDLEWLLTRFPGLDKGRNVYRFAGDMSEEEHEAFLRERFDVLAHIGPEDFAPPPLCRFGDRLDSRLIIARKR